MKYRINYGNKVAVVPKSAIDVMARAGEVEIKVLVGLCATEGNADIKKLSKLTGASGDEINSALAFWRGAGIIDPADKQDANDTVEIEENIQEQPEKENKEPRKKLSRSDELPNYTSDQLSEIIEQRNEIATLIDECQNIVGKVFNVKEINVLVGLTDYLELDFEYIMMLLTYCVSIGKKTLHYAEKTAFSLYDAGICTATQLSEEIMRREKAADIEGKIRSLFGIGERAYTTKEKRLISSWVCEMGYTAEIIEKAYEVTADATGKGSIPYANSILERWHAAGLRTLEEIEQSYKNSDGKDSEGSFATDSFFAAAVERALGGEK